MRARDPNFITPAREILSAVMPGLCAQTSECPPAHRLRASGCRGATMRLFVVHLAGIFVGVRSSWTYKPNAHAWLTLNSCQSMAKGPCKLPATYDPAHNESVCLIHARTTLHSPNTVFMACQRHESCHGDGCTCSVLCLTQRAAPRRCR